MRIYTSLLLLLSAYLQVNGEFSPMVAFMCNKPSMYLNEKGWQRIEDVDCLHDPVDILNFCRRVYHDKQITNVVESTSKVTIGNWCQVDKPDCRHPEHTVTPYKCIVESKDDNELSAEDSNEKRENDVYNKYLHSVGGQYESEHDLYTRARNDLSKVHKDKMSKVMKEWSAARKHIEELKATDPKGAEKLEREVTERFQKTYSALTAELSAEKKQLSNIHEQRVQAKLNEKKRAAMDNYMDTLNDVESEATDILKALQSYIRVEQKDRLHTVGRYQHVLDTDFDEAQAMRSAIIDHLRIISKRIEQAINMLSRVPKLEKKIRVQIDGFMKDNFREVDISVAAILAEPVDKLLNDDVLPAADEKKKPEVEKKKPTDKPVSDQLPLVGQEKHEPVVKKDGVEDKSVESPFDTSQYDSDDNDDYDYESYEEDEGVPVEDQKIEIVPEETLLNEKKAADEAEFNSDENSDEFDDETMEDEHALTEEINAKAAHHEANSLFVDAPSISRNSAKLESSSGTGAIVAIIVATITLFIVLTVGVAVLRQKSRHGKSQLEVDEDLSPEDRHVNAMQVNGYENPTYKYFESKA